MDLSKMLFWQKEEKNPRESIDIVQNNRNKPINRNNFRDFLVRSVKLVSRNTMGRQEFAFPEYDLEEIKMACLSDSYIKMAMMKYSYLIYKAGYSIKSENEQASEYIQQRFRAMSFATGTPMEILFQEIGEDLIKYSNAFLVKARDDNKMPGIKATPIYSTKPVAGYFRIDPSTIRVKRDKRGRITKYMQEVDGNRQEYSPLNIVHFYMDREADDVFGTPRVIAALEDIKILRKIEGNVMSLIYRFSIPIYQIMVGLADKGLYATDPEIEDVRREIEKMSMDGILVTNERTSIKSIGVDGEALDASGYLEYFEKRAFSALGVSEAQMGRGGAKQDADSMEAQAHDTVKHIQRVISIFIENHIMNELLLEGGYNPILNENDIVKYEFNEISLETKVKLENHELYKFQSNIATFDEVRKKIGMKTEADEDRLYVNMIEKQFAIDQIEAKAENETHAGNGKEYNAPKSGQVDSNNNPQNQHGTHAPKIKESYSDPNLHKKTYEEIYKKYEKARNDIIRGYSDVYEVLLEAEREIIEDINKRALQAAQEGALRAAKELNKKYYPWEIEIDISPIEEKVKKHINSLFEDIKDKIKNNKENYSGSIFDTYEYRLKYLLEHLIPKSYWYGYIKLCAKEGIQEVEADFSDGSEDALKYPHEINTKRFKLDDIPAFHPFCNCGIKVGDTD